MSTFNQPQAKISFDELKRLLVSLENKWDNREIESEFPLLAAEAARQWAQDIIDTWTKATEG